MSQAGILALDTSLVPQIPTQFDTNNNPAIPIGNVITIAGNTTQGIDTDGAGAVVTITGLNASDTQKGVASFNAADFTVASGHVSFSGSFMPISGGTFTGTVTFPAGSSGATSFRWTGAGAGTGFYSTGANNLVLQAGGNDLLTFSAFNMAVYRPMIHYSGINLYYQEPAGDYSQDSNTCLVGMDTVGGARTVTLSAGPDSGQWIMIYDKNGNASVNNITINGNGNNIDGSGSTSISIDYGVISMFFDGNNWKII